VIGDTALLAPDVQEAIERAESLTRNNSRSASCYWPVSMLLTLLQRGFEHLFPVHVAPRDGTCHRRGSKGITAVSVCAPAYIIILSLTRIW